MSRIGNQVIPLVNDIKIDIEGKKIKVAGKKGTLEHTIPDEIDVEHEDNQLVVKRKNEGRRSRALHGLTRSLLANMVAGVNVGFQKGLEIHGVGYRAQVKNKKLVLSLGYSHPIEYEIPDDINVTVTDNTKLTVQGVDKQQVGQIAAIIRDFRKPEPYKGKGIRYVNEYILMKEGKTV